MRNKNANPNSPNGKEAAMAREMMNGTAKDDAIVADRRSKATRRTMLRIAELKIQIHGLKDTPEAYIEKCKKRNS